MATTVYIPVDQVDDILAQAGGTAVIQLQSGTAASEPAMSDLATVALVAGQTFYQYNHATGGPSTWYRTRFEDGVGTGISDWQAFFQSGDDTAGYLCSIHDVRQALDQPADNVKDEIILETIRQVSRAIERYCGRWFVPRPLYGTTTYRFHTRHGYRLHVPRGVRSVTSLGYATEDQPTSGGTYTAITAGSWYLDPGPGELDDGEPSTWIILRSGAGLLWSDAAYGAEVTGEFGAAYVPPDIQGVAVRAAVRRYIGKGGGATVAIGPSGTEFLLPDMSGADRAALDSYRRIPVG